MNADSKSLFDHPIVARFGMQDLWTLAGQGQASSTDEMLLASQSNDDIHKQLLAQLAKQIVQIIYPKLC